tara:strand:- start:667 stop:780 length:114 start_codon:yes stop_codon:yes gene_type:complete
MKAPAPVATPLALVGAALLQGSPEAVKDRMARLDRLV